MIPDWILAWLWEHLPHGKDDESICNKELSSNKYCSLPKHDGIFHVTVDGDDVSIWGPTKSGVPELSEYFNSDWWCQQSLRMLNFARELDELPEGQKIFNGPAADRVTYQKRDGQWWVTEHKSEGLGPFESDQIWLPAFTYE